MRRTRLLALVVLLLVVVLPAAQFLVAYLTAPRTMARAYQTTPLPVEVRKMAPHRVRWLLAVRDPNFFRHPGVDLFTPGAGRTTITDALVKRLYFDSSSPGWFPWGMVRESLTALAFDRRVPKMEQLKLFVNAVDFGTEGGRKVRGFDAAARMYFDKSFNAITDEEYLRLVAMILMPGKYHVLRQKANNTKRVSRIRLLLEGDCAPKGHGDVEYPDCEVARL